MIRILNTTTDGAAVRDFIIKTRERGTASDITSVVADIISDVRERGDAALREYTEKFDGVPEVRTIGIDEMRGSLSQISDKFQTALLAAHHNIAAYHEHQKQNGFCVTQSDGVIVGQRVRGLHRVGLYVPGGTAAYPSSVLMNAIPAKIAGVSEIVMVTPPNKDGSLNHEVIAAATFCGIDKIHFCGGAQAVAALAYGTATIPKVDKIVGPGNIYVATAKKMLYGVVDIDMVAGPSEILIIASGEANPAYIAADLMSQAEHDRLASSVLITTSRTLAEEVLIELEKQVTSLSRESIIREALRDFGAVILVRDMDEACAVAELIAPEHCEVLVPDPMRYVGKLDNVGSLFLGEYSPEPLGDYYAGPNHVLPTSGTAGFFSPLSVDSFVKKSSYICYSKETLAKVTDDIAEFAKTEQLTAHANAVLIRQSK